MKLKLRSSARFLASIFDGVGTKVRKDGLATYVDLNYSNLEALTSFDPGTKQIAVNDSVSGVWNKTTLSDLLALSGYVATSLTTATIALTPITFVTQPGLAYRPGARVRASYTGDTSKYVEGLVTAYSGTNLTVAVSKSNGSGTFSSWNINIAGDPGAGDMLSTNNLADVASRSAALNNLSGVSYGAAQSLTFAQMLQARQNISVGSSYADPVDYGADPTGISDCTTAVNNAIASGLPVIFPKGIFKLNSKVTKVFANNTDCFHISGSGKGTTILVWPNANGGISIDGTGFGIYNRFHISDVTLRTGQNGGGSAIKLLNGGIAVFAPFSVIVDVSIQGVDWNNTQLNYWNNGIYTHNWSGITIERVDISGDTIHGFATQSGAAINIEGDLGTSAYVQSIKINNCWLQGQYGILMGDWWQGILVHNTNIGANFDVFVGGGATGLLAQFAINNCILYAQNGGVFTASGVTGFNITNTNIFLVGAGGTGFGLTNTFLSTVVGNTITGPGSGTGLSISGGIANSFTGNTFSGWTTGIFLGSAAVENVVGMNAYHSTVTVKVGSAAPAANNYIGTAGSGNMAGVSP